MEEPEPSKKKRCPKGTRRNKEGICVPIHKSPKQSPKSPPKSPPKSSPKSPPKSSPKPIEDMPTENIELTKSKRKLGVKRGVTKKITDKTTELQEQFKEDIIVPVGKTSKCPKGTRRNKNKDCVLTKEFKDTFIQRKACIQAKRDELI